jgi:hypothetical protein
MSLIDPVVLAKSTAPFADAARILGAKAQPALVAIGSGDLVLGRPQRVGTSLRESAAGRGK